MEPETGSNIEDLQTLVLEHDMAIQRWEQQLEEMEESGEAPLLAVRAQLQFMVLNMKASRVQQLQALRSAREWERHIAPGPVLHSPDDKPPMQEPIPFIVAGRAQPGYCYFCGAAFEQDQLDLDFRKAVFPDIAEELLTPVCRRCERQLILDGIAVMAQRQHAATAPDAARGIAYDP